MDFIGARAIPALVAALATTAARAQEAVPCASIAGVYANLSVETRGGSPRRLSDFATAEQRRRLHRFEGGSGVVAQGEAPKARPKVTPVASRVVVAASASGGAVLRFFDDNGRLIAETRMDSPGAWKCTTAGLERAEENLSGLGNDIRTERLEQRLHRDDEGDLVLTETVTNLDAPGAAYRTLWRFNRLSLSS